MTASSYNNGVSESRGYNTDNTLASISFSGASIGNLTYGWDDNKNKTSESITSTTSGYGFSVGSSGYDSEDRLVNFNRTDGNLDQAWSLSEVGDWDSVTTEGVAQTRTHGASHELLTGGGGSVTHDVKGNMTLIPSQLRPDSTALAMTWDMDNRLSTADVGNDSSVDVTYKFDALGRRVYRDDGTTAMVYVQVGQQTIADYVAGTVDTSPDFNYVYASYIDEPIMRDDGSAKLYYHRNQQYSIVALTDGSGSIVERYAYSAYGVPTLMNSGGLVLSSSGYDNRYTYTGREWDQDLHLYHYRARMYDSSLGRFCSKDPIGYVDGQSLYRAYFAPKRLDLTGKWTPEDMVGGHGDGGLCPRRPYGSGAGTVSDPVDGDGSDPDLCDWVNCNLNFFALGVNQTLLDHWRGGSGSSLTVDFSWFDPTGYNTSAGISGIKSKLFTSAKALSCGSSVGISRSLPMPIESNRTSYITPMIFGWLACSPFSDPGVMKV